MKLWSAFLLLALTGSAMAQPEDPQLRKEMESVFSEWDNHLRAGNYEAIMDQVAPDFVLVDSQGRRTTAVELRSMLSGTVRKSHRVDCETRVMNVRGKAGEAVVWVAMKSRLFGKGSPVRYFAHSLRQTPTGWQIYYSQMLPTDNGWRPGGGKRYR